MIKTLLLIKNKVKKNLKHLLNKMSLKILLLGSIVKKENHDCQFFDVPLLSDVILFAFLMSNNIGFTFLLL